MITIDGSKYSGSGTIVRYSVALAALIGEPLHIYGIRSRREKPGLRPQHLTALRACCSICSGVMEGDEVGSTEFFFRPGTRLRGGTFQWNIGTAGSATMLAYTLISPALFAETPSEFLLTGGLFQDNAPTAFHMQNILVPIICSMGAEIRLEIARPGYVPKGQGLLRMIVNPVKSILKPLRMLSRGNLIRIRGTALASHLEKERVAERMADRCQKILSRQGIRPEIKILHDSSAIQKGAALFLCAETEKGCLIGADGAGKLGRRSESIADFVVASLLEDLRSESTVDRHTADQLIIFGALADGETTYCVPKFTEHIESNLWLTEKILGAKSTITANRLTIKGVGCKKM